MRIVDRLKLAARSLIPLVLVALYAQHENTPLTTRIQRVSDELVKRSDGRSHLMADPTSKSESSRLTRLAQWINWPNWGNWSNWGNWDKMPQWGDYWTKWINY